MDEREIRKRKQRLELCSIVWHHQYQRLTRFKWVWSFTLEDLYTNMSTKQLRDKKTHVVHWIFVLNCTIIIITMINSNNKSLCYCFGSFAAVRVSLFRHSRQLISTKTPRCWCLDIMCRCRVCIDSHFITLELQPWFILKHFCHIRVFKTKMIMFCEDNLAQPVHMLSPDHPERTLARLHGYFYPYYNFSNFIFSDRNQEQWDDRVRPWTTKSGNKWKNINYTFSDNVTSSYLPWRDYQRYLRYILNIR